MVRRDKTERRVWGLLLGVVLLLASCALPVRAPLEAPPTDLDHYITESGWRGDYRISPDGQRLLWIEQAPGGDPVIAAQRVAGGEIARFPAGRIASASAVFQQVVWLGDSRHIAWVQDETGDENTQIWVADSGAPSAAPRNLTPWPGAKSAIQSVGGPKGTLMHIVSNRRDARVFDLLRLDYQTGDVTELARNPGDVESWITDLGTAALAGRIRAEGRMRILEIRDKPDAPWRQLRRWAATGSYVRALNRGRSSLVLATNQGYNTVALVRVDLATASETVLFHDPKLDVTRSFYSTAQDRVYAVQTDPGYPRTRILIPGAEERLTRLLAHAAGEALLGFEIQNTDRAVNRIVFRTHGRSGTQELLLDRREERITVLRDSRKHPLAARLAISEPVSVTARDGRELHGYLMRPPGRAGEKLPLVVNVHGGPWLRDRFLARELNPGAVGGSGNTTSQQLVQRGVATLRINYRGSSGYGEEHMLAGAKTLGDRTQDDIEDAVRWAIREGFADPDRIVVSGGSFGGFSVLRQVTRASGLYRCAISSVGVADWRRQIERHPPYWWPWTENYHFNYADPRTPAGLAELKRISPLHALEQIGVPLLLLHGRNDIRVPVEDSDEVHAGLQKLGRESHYLRYEGEGHSVLSAKNRLASWRMMDAFLKRCLQ
jgi:dipeptidyl aminopeptidase/acylaminoacyl peptidase